MKVRITEDAPVLIPNDSHKNFVATDKVIKANTELEGKPTRIQGLRRGKPFIYRLFIDDNGIIIYDKYTEKMQTEVTLNAVGTEARVVTLPSAKKDRIIHAVSAVGAGVLAFAIAKKTGRANKTAFMYAGASALVGYLVASQITKHRKITYEKK
jgi:hypothetical protein